MKSENNKLKFNFRIVKHNFLQLDVSLALCSGSGLPPPFSPTDPSFPSYPAPSCCPRPCQKVVNICSLHATCFAFLCPFALSSLLSLASAAAFPSYCCCCFVVVVSALLHSTRVASCFFAGCFLFWNLWRRRRQRRRRRLHMSYARFISTPRTPPGSFSCSCSCRSAGPR